jgi:hypothetical protein
MDPEDLAKPQNIRLADVFILGPFSIWFGLKAKEMPTWARVAMMAYGTGTIFYNGKNYLEIEEAERKKFKTPESE